MFWLKALQGFKNGCGMQFFYSFFFTTCWDHCHPVQFVCTAKKELKTGRGVGTRLGCCQIEQVAIICILIFHICKKIANFWQKSKKKKMNLPFQDKRTRKEKWMGTGALRQLFFLFSLICLLMSSPVQVVLYPSWGMEFSKPIHSDHMSTIFIIRLQLATKEQKGIRFYYWCIM